nr:MAG TPA: hypothetical protein [Caudoviricetes sp.]
MFHLVSSRFISFRYHYTNVHFKPIKMMDFE